MIGIHQHSYLVVHVSQIVQFDNQRPNSFIRSHQLSSHYREVFAVWDHLSFQHVSLELESDSSQIDLSKKVFDRKSLDIHFGVECQIVFEAFVK